MLLSVRHFGDDRASTTQCNARPEGSLPAPSSSFYTKKLVFTTLWVRVTFRFTAGDTHTHTQTDIEGRSPSNGGKSLGSIDSKENERPSQLAPTCQYKGSCLSRLLVLEVLVEEPYKTEGGGALPRRTHEILTQFYMTFVLSALASPPHS